jgi:hypothetical protein
MLVFGVSGLKIERIIKEASTVLTTMERELE